MPEALNKFQPIEEVTLTAIPTEQAAFYLSRRPATLRSWSHLENGLLTPIET